MKQLTAVLFLSLFAITAKAQVYYMLVGTYDSPTSEGIYVYKFDSKDGSVKAVSQVKTSNPSFLSVSPNQRFVYAVNENADSTRYTVTGHVAAFSFNKKTGTLTFLNKQESGGKHPCYVETDKTGKWVIAGNYSSGSFAVLPVKANGKLDSAKKILTHTGSGPDTSRQKSPHVHGIFLRKNNTSLYVTDLGIDKVMSYRFDAATGKVTPAKIPFIQADGGSGPRHLAFHPTEKYMYLLEEMLGTVAVFRDSAQGNYKPIQSLFALPPYYRGPIGSADIHVSPDGKFLYCSNRGLSNTIAIFSIDAKTGMITLVGHQDTMGETPRNFNFDPTGKFLIVANQNSNEIVIFKRDVKTGLLTDTGKRISVGKPVCIKWINTK